MRLSDTILKASVFLSACLLTVNIFAQTTPPAQRWDKRFGGSKLDEIRSLQQTLDGGYILGGYSESKIGYDKTEDSRGSSDYWVVKINPAGIKQWDKRFGGKGADVLFALQQTSDGGYILGGSSTSGINGDRTEPNWGGGDYWVVKVDSNGIKQWDKRFGGVGIDEFRSLQQTSDGGYILGGWSESGIGGDKTEDRRGDWDYWVVKIDSNGIKQWDKCFGGSGRDSFCFLRQTTDGGYILGGTSNSLIGFDKTEDSRGYQDYWVVKIDSNGMKQWDKVFGGSSAEFFGSLAQASDGGYILGGASGSPIGGDKTEDSRGAMDYWVVKIDSTGVKQWDKRFGGTSWDYLECLQLTSDGGYILGGYSESGIGGDQSVRPRGFEDYWVVKIDSTGAKEWDNRFGGYRSEVLYSLQQTSDGGYVLGGYSESRDEADITDVTEECRGEADYWVVKIDENGVLPISLQGFTALQVKEDVAIKWQTVSEENSGYFAVEHSTDGRTFLLIGTVVASGNSAVLKDYSFLHAHPGKGTHYYRLKSVDNDGGFSYSVTATVYIDDGINILMYPNPTRGNVTVLYNCESPGSIQLNVFDVSGKKLFAKTVQAIAGSNLYQINLSMLGTGVYTLRINNGVEQKQVKFVIEK